MMVNFNYLDKVGNNLLSSGLCQFAECVHGGESGLVLYAELFVGDGQHV